ncbi:MAG: FeoA family protein [Oscillospiraceae bacterium]
MMERTRTLNQLPIGSQARVSGLLSQGRMRRRLLDLGLVDGTLVKSIYSGPSGDPVAYEIRGAVIALRGEDSAQILVES